jgi:hypothetical protein
VWSSKDAAATWALARAEDPGLIRMALAVRHGDRSQALDPARVDRFVRDIQARVERAAARSPDAATAGDPAQQLVQDRGDRVTCQHEIASLQQSRDGPAQRT